MKSFLTFAFSVLIVLCSITSLRAQAEFFPKHDTSTQGIYLEGNLNTLGAGARFAGITAGVEYHEKFGQAGLYLTARITPVVLQGSSVELIAGASGSAGYFIEGERDTKAIWAPVAGIRFPTIGIELTSQYKIHYGEDYWIPVSLRWYL